MRDRFKDAMWFDTIKRYRPTIGGSGGIGSWLTFLLARAGATPIVFDFDRIEEHNIGGQLFDIQSVGEYKVDALQAICEDFSNVIIETHKKKLDQNSLLTKMCFSAFDNMEARKDMFNKWLTIADEESIFIDGRLTFDNLQIFCVRGSDASSIEEYKRTHLFDDSDVEDAPCTLKQTSHNAAMIASFMVNFYVNHLADLEEGAEVSTGLFKPPFYTSYYTPFNHLEVEYGE